MLLIILILSFLASCEKGDRPIITEGTLIRSCTPWQVKVQDKSGNLVYLELLNLDDFDFEPELDLRVIIKYRNAENWGSSCQMGPIIELIRIHEIE